MAKNKDAGKSSTDMMAEKMQKKMVKKPSKPFTKKGPLKKAAKKK